MIKKKAIITGAVLIPIGYFFIIKPWVINPILLRNNYAFTKATVISLKASVNGEPDYYFNYKVNDEIFDGYFMRDPQYIKRIGDCYWLKYYPSNPNVAKIYLNKPCSSVMPDN